MRKTKKDYRKNITYSTLKKMREDAGIKVLYGEGPSKDKCVMMPDTFPDPVLTRCCLGHEAVHILSRLDDDGTTAEHRRNETVCDLIGNYLYQLA